MVVQTETYAKLVNDIANLAQPTEIPTTLAKRSYAVSTLRENVREKEIDPGFLTPTASKQVIDSLFTVKNFLSKLNEPKIQLQNLTGKINANSIQARTEYISLILELGDPNIKDNTQKDFNLSFNELISILQALVSLSKDKNVLDPSTRINLLFDIFAQDLSINSKSKEIDSDSKVQLHSLLTLISR